MFQQPVCILTSHLFAERSKKFDVEELIRDVPSLKEIQNAYHDADLVMPTKKNRHAALTNRSSIQHEAIMSLIPNKGATRNSTIDASRRAQSNPRGKLKSLIDRKNTTTDGPTLSLQKLQTTHGSRDTTNTNSAFHTLNASTPAPGRPM